MFLVKGLQWRIKNHKNNSLRVPYICIERVVVTLLDHDSSLFPTASTLRLVLFICFIQ